MDRVDAHAHIFAPASDDYPREVNGLFPAERSGAVGALLDEMDGAGIDRAVLIQLGGCGIRHHRYVAEALQRWPDRLAGVGLVDLGDPDPAARLSELHDATGIRGIRLMGPLGPPDAAAAEELPAFALLRRASELGVHVNLYCPGDQVGNIEMAVRAVPGVTFSLDHLGICPTTKATVDRWQRPRFENEPMPPAGYDRVLGLAGLSNVLLKVSGEYAFSGESYPFPDITPMVSRAYTAFGAERLMWCSDFPWIVREPGYARLAATIDHHLPEISAAEKAQIMGQNALRVWFDD